MPLQATSGAASYDAFGGGVPYVPAYIEDVFSTFLYTGNSSTQTITNGIDLSTKGGLVWLKGRTTGSTRSNHLFDTARGSTSRLLSDTTDAANTGSGSAYLSGFSGTGFSLGFAGDTNFNNEAFVSWTFRKQPKFFDVVTYTGDGTVDRNIAHNLGSMPGWVMVKKTSGTGDWLVSVREINSGFNQIKLNTTAAIQEGAYGPRQAFGSDTTFNIWSGGANDSGATYVAYLFAHNAGGFGLTGTDNVISCGSYSGNGITNGPTITLGYEPQWLLIKESSSSGNWWLTDSARGFTSSTNKFLLPNSSGDEITKTSPTYARPEATGFKITSSDFDVNEGGGTYIYMAIRKGPMR
jgi:hypothetical protein